MRRVVDMPSIADALRSTLGAAQLDVAQRLASACEELGCQAYIVGGTVRDALLGLPAADLDVTVVSPPDDFPKRVAAFLGARLIMASQFGTAKLEKEGSTLDLVMARSERYRSPGALPDVTAGSLDDDLTRRDFAINAMAASLDAAKWGELVDPHGGRRDLELGLVRALHERSFQDDATRILRAARYASRFGFRLDAETAKQIERSGGYLVSISPDRFKHELERVFEESRVSSAIELLSKWEMLGLTGGDFVYDETSWSGFAEACAVGSSERRLVGWGVFSLCFQTVRSSGIALRWKLDHDASMVSMDALKLRERLRVSDLNNLAPSGQVALLENYSPYAVLAFQLSTRDGTTNDALDEYRTKLTSIRPDLDGHDVIALGVPRGPRVGEALQMLKNARLDRTVESRNDETLLVRQFVTKLDQE